MTCDLAAEKVETTLYTLVDKQQDENSTKIQTCKGNPVYKFPRDLKCTDHVSDSSKHWFESHYCAGEGYTA